MVSADFEGGSLGARHGPGSERPIRFFSANPIRPAFTPTGAPTAGGVISNP